MENIFSFFLLVAAVQAALSGGLAPHPLPGLRVAAVAAVTARLLAVGAIGLWLVFGSWRKGNGRIL